MRTKYDILVEKAEKLEREAQNIRFVLKDAGETPCLITGTEEHIHCGTCGVKFETELDYMKHYHVPHELYYNLGHCPWKDTANEALEQWNKYWEEAVHQGLQDQATAEDYLLYVANLPEAHCTTTCPPGYHKHIERSDR